MMTWKRTWLCCAFGALLTACGNPQNHTDVPDQPSNPDQTPVIVLGRSTFQPERTHEPLAVAAEEPELAVAATPEPRHISGADLAALVRDPRKQRWFPRSTSLLITEIQSLEALLAATPNALDRPKFVRRLAETYIELKNAALRDKLHARTSTEVAKSEKVAVAARAHAVKHYEEMALQHRNFCQVQHPTDPAKNIGCLDETLYFLGVEYLELDKPDAARKQFFLLIKDFPQSKWVPHAYLAFGELFLAEGAADASKLEFAQKSYEKVTQFPPPQNETHGFAHYRLGQVFAQKQDFPNALAQMMKAAEFVANFAALPIAEPLGAAVRRDVVPIYAAVGTPRKAEPFFQRLANDPSGSNERLVSMLDALVKIYLRENKRAEAIEVCRSFSGSANVLRACQQLVPSALPPGP